MAQNTVCDVDCLCSHCLAFNQGYDCGVRYYVEGRSLLDNPFSADDIRSAYFYTGFRQAQWSNRDPACLIV